MCKGRALREDKPLLETQRVTYWCSVGRLPEPLAVRDGENEIT